MSDTVHDPTRTAAAVGVGAAPAAGVAVAAGTSSPRHRGEPSGRRSASTREALSGWLFTAPALVLLSLFIVAPIGLAIWVSIIDWNGTYSPLSGRAEVVGVENYQRLLTEEGLLRRDFALSIRNTFWFVVLVVPLQTALALGLALVVNNAALRGRAFFRAVFYFPSVTSSVAIAVVFLFLFSGAGVVNELLGFIGVDGPTWFADARGVGHQILGGIGLVDPTAPPAALNDTRVFSLSLWEWISGPSVALITLITLVVWTTSGTFMLMFLAALQNLPGDVLRAALVDGAGRWTRFRRVTLPLLLPTVFLVMTLGLIGTWQVFDQVYVMGQGDPGKTTLTPAFLSYQRSFKEGAYGIGAAIAFVLFAIIVTLAYLQRKLLRNGGEK